MMIIFNLTPGPSQILADNYPRIQALSTIIRQNTVGCIRTRQSEIHFNRMGTSIIGIRPVGAGRAAALPD